MTSLLSFDMEEWFHGLTDAEPASRASMESTIEEEFDFIAEVLAGSGRSATFFVLAEVARSHPQVVRRIAEAGWEVASHGAGHRCVYESSRAQFRERLRRSVRELEDVSGSKVRGYRAPLWSIDSTTEWAIEVMLDQGLEYDSSVFPMGRRDPRRPFYLRSAGGVILEVPPMPVRLGRLFWSLSSGISLRLLPWWLYRALLRHEAKRSGYLHLYLHPWELSTAGWNLAGVALEKRAFFTLGRRGACAKFRRLIRQFAFGSVAEALESIRASTTEIRDFDEITFYRVPKSGVLQPLRSGGVGALSLSAKKGGRRSP